MKTKLSKMATMGLMMVAIAAWGALLFPGETPAQTVPVVCPGDATKDFDLDGFSDAEECAGITLTNGMSTVPEQRTSVPSCRAADLADPTLRKGCVDPNTKDLFVILNKASGSNLDTYLGTADPLAVLRKTLNQGGLGITIHQVTDTTARDRKVTSTQKALRVSESLDPSGVETGVCTQGTPNGLDNCVVFSQRIVNLIVAKCPAGTSCALNTGVTTAASTVQTVIATYFQDTIAHESSHALSLAPIYDSRLGGNHYKTGTNVVMD